MTVAEPTGPAVAPPRSGNPYGVVAIVLVAIVAVLGAVTRITALRIPVLAAQDGITTASIDLIFNVLAVVGFVLALGAMFVGLVGVTRVGRPHALAAAGMTIGIFAAANVLIPYILNSLTAAVMSR